jgi:hypothetical protein
MKRAPDQEEVPTLTFAPDALPGKVRNNVACQQVGLGLGLAACQKGLAVGFITAATLVNELHEAHDEKRLLRLQRQLAGYKLLIVDELGYAALTDRRRTAVRGLQPAL